MAIREFKQQLEAYMFLSPALIIMLSFLAYPVVYFVYSSFFDW